MTGDLALDRMEAREPSALDAALDEYYDALSYYIGSASEKDRKRLEAAEREVARLRDQDADSVLPY